MTQQFARHRRLRSSATMRKMVRENQLTVADFIYPLFISAEATERKPIDSMPGIDQIPLDALDDEIKSIVALGIPAVLLFGIPTEKDAVGTDAYCEHGIVQQAIQQIKALTTDLLVIADTCLCEFTDHGHCGVIVDNDVDNDASLTLLAQSAVSQAKAGADIIAPSNMMDGFVAVIRQALDEAGFSHIPIMSYAVKYASAFYGPFREAAESAPQFGNRKTYQMDAANRLEALREAQSDVEEGADFLMVKPGLAYLDIVRDLANTYPLPLVTYHVSGEYAMVKAAAAQQWIDEKAIVLETMLSMKRAGATLIITYYAKEIAQWLKEGAMTE